MAFDIGAITGRLVLDSTQWNQSIKKAKEDSKSFEGAILRNQGAIIKMGVALTAVGGIITGVSVKLLRMASDVEESENLFEVSMGNMAGAARRWSNELSKSLGLNQFEIRRNIGVLNVMTKEMGLTEGAAFEVSRNLTQLSYDLASLFNLKPEEAFLKIQSGISGEIEPLKRLGIVVNETTVKNFALTQGLIKQNEELTEAQKVMARYGVIMNATKTAQGDLERTITSITNQWRILGSSVDELAVKLGKNLIPVVKPLISVLVQVVKVISSFADKYPKVTASIVIFTSALGALALAVGPLLIALPGLAAAAAALNTTMLALAGGSVIVLFKLAAAVTAVVLAFQNWRLITAVALGVGATLQELFQLLSQGLANTLNLLAKIPGPSRRAFQGLALEAQKMADDFEDAVNRSEIAMKDFIIAHNDAQNEMGISVDINTNIVGDSFSKMWDEITAKSKQALSGVKTDTKTWLQQLQEGFNLAEEVGRRTFNVMADNFSSLFFDVMKGEVESFKELFADFGDSILRIIADIAAQWVAMQLITGIVSGVTGIFGGFGGGVGRLGGVADAAASTTSASGGILGSVGQAQDAIFGNLPGGFGIDPTAGFSIGSFKEGTERVPFTQLAKVHAGEEIRNTDQVAGGRGDSVPIEIHNHITPEAVAAAMSQKEGRNVIVNVIDKNAMLNGTIRKRMLER